MYLQIEEGVDGFRNQSNDNGRDAGERPDVFPVLRDVPIPPEEDSVGRVASDVPGQPGLLALLYICVCWASQNLPNLQRMTLGVLIPPEEVQTRPADGELQQNSRPVRSNLLAVVGVESCQSDKDSNTEEEPDEYIAREFRSLLSGVYPSQRQNHESDIQFKPS